MARAPLEEPDGIVLRPEVITREEESGLLERFATLRWDPIVIRGQAARRTARHFGLGYDYQTRTPAFGIVVGISLLGRSRLRFQRGRRERRRVWEVDLEPRSGYVLAGEARWSWEHSIPPAKELRYSITFRTLK